jgi:hypothetical protein
MKSDGTKNKNYRWLLNFLSTGEVSVVDKIAETGKFKAHAGQEVRIIELPIDATNEVDNVVDKSLKTFGDLHGLSNSNEFSVMLEKNSKKYYGIPLRSFIFNIIQKLAIDNKFIDNRLAEIDLFVKNNCPEGSSGQVLRVARKFGLIAVAGELAIEFSIFPCDRGEALRATERWFKVWLDLREGIDNKEILRTLSDIKEHFVRYGDSKYIDTRYESSSSCEKKEYYGFKFVDNDDNQNLKYLMLTPHVTQIFNKVNRNEMIQKLLTLGYIDSNSTGQIKDQKSIFNRNRRGLIFTPSAWEGKPEKNDIIDPF